MTVRPELRALVARAAANAMTPAQRERQIESLAFGNAKIENDRVTKPQIVDAARRTPR